MTHTSSTDKNIYIYWDDKYEMSENRIRGINCLKDFSKVNVILVNDQSFYSYEVEEIKIHKAFKYLSSVHKSDYFRAYMMYFYGGGYSDIKRNSFSWLPFFNKLSLSSFDAIGYNEISPNNIADFPKDDRGVAYVKHNYSKFIGAAHYIFKPRTRFAYLWLTEIHDVLDKKYDLLSKNPAKLPRSGYPGYDPEYPLIWAEINGMIFYRLQYEQNGLFLGTMPYTNRKEYQ